MNDESKDIRAEIEKYFVMRLSHGDRRTELRLLDKKSGQTSAILFGSSVDEVLDLGLALAVNAQVEAGEPLIAEEEPEPTTADVPLAEVVGGIDPATGRYRDQTVEATAHQEGGQIVVDDVKVLPSKSTLRRDIVEAARIMDEKSVPMTDRHAIVEGPDGEPVVVDIVVKPEPPKATPKPAKKRKRKKKAKPAQPTTEHTPGPSEPIPQSGTSPTP